MSAEIEFTPEEIATEEWRDVIGYEGVYSVSNLGRLRRDAEPWKGNRGRCRPGAILKANLDRAGYALVKLTHNGVGRSFTLQSVVAAAFLGPRPVKYEINHKRPETGKANNRAENLEYLSKAEHEAHTSAHGLRRTVLTPVKVLEIRAATGLHRVIAEQYGIARASVGDIKTRRTWNHLP